MVGSEPMPHNLGSEPTANITEVKGVVGKEGWLVDGYGNPMRRLHVSGGIGMGNTTSSRSITTPSPEQLHYITIILLYMIVKNNRNE